MNLESKQQNKKQERLSESDFGKTIKLINWRLNRDKFLHTECDDKRYDHETYMKIFWYEKGHIEGIEWVLELLEHPEKFIFDTEQETIQGVGSS